MTQSFDRTWNPHLVPSFLRSGQAATTQYVPAAAWTHSIIANSVTNRSVARQRSSSCINWIWSSSRTKSPLSVRVSQIFDSFHDLRVRLPAVVSRLELDHVVGPEFERQVCVLRIRLHAYYPGSS